MKSKNIVQEKLRNSETEIDINVGLYKSEIQKLSTEGLNRIFKDRSEALKFAKKGIKKIDPRNLSDENVDALASEMQFFAKLILEERKF